MRRPAASPAMRAASPGVALQHHVAQARLAPLAGDPHQPPGQQRRGSRRVGRREPGGGSQRGPHRRRPAGVGAAAGVGKVEAGGQHGARGEAQGHVERRDADRSQRRDRGGAQARGLEARQQRHGGEARGAQVQARRPAQERRRGGHVGDQAAGLQARAEKVLEVHPLRFEGKDDVGRKAGIGEHRQRRVHGQQPQAAAMGGDPVEPLLERRPGPGHQDRRLPAPATSSRRRGAARRGSRRGCGPRAGPCGSASCGSASGRGSCPASASAMRS